MWSPLRYLGSGLAFSLTAAKGRQISMVRLHLKFVSGHAAARNFINREISHCDFLHDYSNSYAKESMSWFKNASKAGKCLPSNVYLPSQYLMSTTAAWHMHSFIRLSGWKQCRTKDSASTETIWANGDWHIVWQWMYYEFTFFSPSTATLFHPFNWVTLNSSIRSEQAWKSV